MKVLELDQRLRDLKISSRSYSLNGDLKPDAIILFHNYAKWEVFYLDERGGRNDERVFVTEEEACLYVYVLFVKGKDIAEKFGMNVQIKKKSDI